MIMNNEIISRENVIVNFHIFGKTNKSNFDWLECDNDPRNLSRYVPVTPILVAMDIILDFHES